MFIWLLICCLWSSDIFADGFHWHHYDQFTKDLDKRQDITPECVVTVAV